MARQNTYSQNVSDKAARLRAATARLKLATEVAQMNFDLASRNEPYRQQLDQWRDQQVAAIEVQWSQRMAEAFPAAFAARIALLTEAQATHAFELQDAEHEFTWREEQRRAAAQEQRRAAKVAKWQASPAGQQAAADAARDRAQEQADIDAAMQTGHWPSSLARWMATEEMAVGIPEVEAMAAYVRTAPQRAAFLQAWPDQRDAAESPERAAWDARDRQRGGRA